ncbi:hypothetical protein ABEB36_011362 [Hypothenemus hampei]|uniref:Transposase n=1 Tax=Hypothenemus hampei TaxID=57062 RepID=A0ABD1EF60_HYPHA
MSSTVKTCKSCGECDHLRRSSSKCRNHIKSQKLQFSVGGIGELTEYTIKRGFRKFCRHPRLKIRIEEDVIHISSLMMENCIVVHFFFRIVRYYSAKYPQSKRKWEWRVVVVFEKLFSSKHSTARTLQVSEFLEDFGFPQNTKFVNLEKNWWSLITFSYRLAQQFPSHELKSFSLFPIFQPGRKHIRYNCLALYQLLHACDLELNVTQEQCSESSPLFWWRYFNLNRTRYGELDELNIKIRVHKDRRCFALSFSTNGIDASLLMNKFSGHQQEDEEEISPLPRRGRLRKGSLPSISSSSSENFDYYLGLDPGVVNYVGACLRHEPSGKEIKSIVKSEHFKQSLCRERLRTKRRKRKTRGFENMLLRDRVEIEIEVNVKLHARVSHNYRDNLEYIQCRLVHLEASQEMCGRKTICRLKFDSWKCHRKATDDLVNKLLFPPERVERDKKVLPAVIELKKAFHRRHDKCKVQDVDEFRTSRRWLPDLLPNESKLPDGVESRHKRCSEYHIGGNRIGRLQK